MPEKPTVESDSILHRREKSFYQKLSQLPKDFQDKWEGAYDQIILDQGDELSFFDEFDAFFNNRNKTVAKMSWEIHADLSEKLRNEILAAEDSIRKTFGDPNFFLGNGRTAEVYSLPIAPHLCVKYITDQEAYNEGNHMRTEYDFLDQLHNFQAASVRTPQPYFIRIHPSEGHSYGMERIEGESLSRILERPTDNVELIQLLKTVNRETVEKDLITYIEALHKKFKITHNDLAKRNIMVDTSGCFYVIDFGKAKQEQIGEDHETFRKSDITRLSSEVKIFFKKLDEININDTVN